MKVLMCVFLLLFYRCKTAYTGHVRVDYSVDHGATWVPLQQYQVWQYVQDNFFPIKLEIPEEDYSTHVRFRFTQDIFEAARDNWAIDNVKVSDD